MVKNRLANVFAGLFFVYKPSKFQYFLTPASNPSADGCSPMLTTSDRKVLVLKPRCFPRKLSAIFVRNMILSYKNHKKSVNLFAYIKKKQYLCDGF